MTNALRSIKLCTLAIASIMALSFVALPLDAQAQDAERVFELRTYKAAPGKLDALLKRFRDHTMRIFEKHGMSNVAYWVPTDEPDDVDTDEPDEPADPTARVRPGILAQPRATGSGSEGQRADRDGVSRV